MLMSANNSENQRALDSNFLWILEQEETHKGGPAQWENCFRLRHLISNLYLCRDQYSDVFKNAMSRDGRSFAMCLVSNRDIPKTTWRFTPSQRARAKKNIMVGNGMYICSKETRESGWLNQGPLLDSIQETSFAADLGEFEEDSALIISSCQSDVLQDTMYSLSIVHWLQRVVESLESLSRKAPVEQNMMHKIAEVIIQTVLFCKDKTFTNVSKYDGFETWTLSSQLSAIQSLDNTFLISHHQTLLREQRALEYLFRLINLLAYKLSRMKAKGATTDGSATEMDKKKSKKKNFEFLSKLCKSLYHSVNIIFSNNLKNQIYSVQWMGGMIEHINLDIGSAFCLTELVENNLKLLEEKVAPSHIMLFFSLIRKHGCRPDYVKFLLTLCACNGQAVDSNQNFICELLIESNLDLLLTVRFDKSERDASASHAKHTLPLDTTDLECFTTNDGGPMLGSELLQSAPQIVMTWDVKQDALSPNSLFGSKWVPIHVFAHIGHSDPETEQIQIHLDKAAEVKMKRRRQVYQYFIYQIELLATLCLDRNYIGIEGFEKLLPFDLTLLALTDPSLPMKLRAAFVKLLQHLWIDRAPQKTMALPEFTKLWGDRARATIFPETNNPNKFAIVQAILEKYFRQSTSSQKLHAKDEPEYSKAMANILRSLTIFGYYDRIKEIHGIAEPILHAVDGRPTQRDFFAAKMERKKRKAAKRNQVLPSNTGNDSNGSTRATTTPTSPITTTTGGVEVAEIIDLGKPQSSMNKMDDDDDDDSSLDNSKLTEDDSITEELSLKERLENFMDAKPYMIFIIVMTVLSVIQGAISMFNTSCEGDSEFMKLLEYFFIALFTGDFIFRCWAMGSDRYFIDWLCVIDFLIVAIDWVSLLSAASESNNAVQDCENSGGSASTLVRTFRLLRMLRLLRLIRAAKLARQLYLMAKSSMFVIESRDPVGNRYKLTNESASLLESKLELVKMLRLVTDISIEYRLGSFMRLMRETIEEISDKKTAKKNLGKNVYLIFSEKKNKEKCKIASSIFEELFSTRTYCSLDVLTLSSERSKSKSVDKTGNGIIGDVTDVCLDLLMYDHTELVGEALQLLLSYYQQRRLLCDALANTQVIVDNEMADKYENVRDLVQKTQGSVEAFEAWGDNEDKEYVLDELRKLCNWMEELERACKEKISTDDDDDADDDDGENDENKKLKKEDSKRSRKQDENSEIQYRPIPEMQTAILNLDLSGLIDEMLKVDLPEDDDGDDDDILLTGMDGKSLSSNDKNGNKDDENEITKTMIDNAVLEMLGTFNSFLIALCRDNKAAQRQLFSFVDEIVERIGKVPYSNELLCSLFQNNEELSIAAPDSLVEEVVVRIYEAEEPDSEYLEFLHTINLSSESNQLRVLTMITHPRYAEKTLLLYGDPSSPGYQRRIKLMQQPNCMQEPLLQYHTQLIRLLANCCDGELNIAEAKVQSLYNWKWILHAIHDKYVVWNVKLPLMYLFYHMSIEAETKTKGLANSSEMIQFLKLMNLFMKTLADINETQMISHLDRMKRLPVKTNFWLCENDSKTVKQITSSKDNLVLFIHYYVFPLVEKICEQYGPDLPEDQAEAPLVQISEYTMTVIQNAAGSDSEVAKAIVKSGSKCAQAMGQYLPFVNRGFMVFKAPSRNDKDDVNDENGNKDEMRKKQTSEIERDCFDCISTELLPHSNLVHTSIESEIHKLVERIKSKNNPNETINVANILRRIIWLIRQRILPGNKQYHHILGATVEDDSELAETAKAETEGGLRLLLAYINSCGEECSNDRDICQDQAVDIGTLELCIDLISRGIPTSVRALASQVSMSILVEHGDGGGNVTAQERVYSYLNNGKSESFFYGISEQLNISMRPNEKRINFTDEDTINLLEMVRLLMEGHHSKNQSILRVQSNNKTVVNVMQIVAEYASHLGRNINEESIEVLGQIMEFLVESVQGPCYGNQKFLACNTGILDLCNRLIHYILSLYEKQMGSAVKLLYKKNVLNKRKTLLRKVSFSKGKKVVPLEGGDEGEDEGKGEEKEFSNGSEDEEKNESNEEENYNKKNNNEEDNEEEEEDEHFDKCREVYGAVIQLLLGLMEGRTDHIVHQAILGALNLNNVLSHLKLLREDSIFYENQSGKRTEQEEEKEESNLETATDVGATLLMLRDLNEEWFTENVESSRVWHWLQGKMNSVEIFWLGKLHRVFFASPDLYEHVVKVSQDALVQNVERTNAETKLRGFLDEVEVGLYPEMIHLENMAKWNLHHIFSGKNLNYAKEMSYYLALCINFILLISYRYDQCVSDGSSGDGDSDGRRRLDGDDGDASLCPDPSLSEPHLKAPFQLWGITDDSIQSIVGIFGIIQMLASSFIFILFLAVQVPPEFKKYDNVILTLLKTPVLYYMTYAILAALGVSGYYLAFTFHLMDVIVRDATTQAVLMAGMFSLIIFVSHSYFL
eukprot:g2831.t1